MKAFGFVLTLVGLAGLGIGGWFLAGIIRRVADARVAQTFTYQGRSLAASSWVNVSTDRLCQLSAIFHPDLHAFGDVDTKEIRDEYDVSVSFRVLDETDHVLLDDRDGVWGTLLTSNGLTGNVELSRNSEKFPPPSSGRLRVESIWSPKGKGRIRAAEVLVYDRVSIHTQPAVYAGLFGVSGGAFALLGGALLVLQYLGARRDSKAAAPKAA